MEVWSLARLEIKGRSGERVRNEKVQDEDSWDNRMMIDGIGKEWCSDGGLDASDGAKKKDSTYPCQDSPPAVPRLVLT